MAEETYKYVYHNGVYIHVNQLIVMAKNAGDYSLAQPFLVSLLYHANRFHLQHINDEVDKIRKHYNLAPFPSVSAPASINNMPNFEAPMKKQAEIAREYYSHLIKDQREELLKEGLEKLRFENEELFMKKACWIGIYLVVKGRLDDEIKMQAFCYYKITPKSWPAKLALGPKTLSNSSRYIKGNDQFKPYYLMENNPFKDLSNKYWEILLSLILTKKSNSK